MAGEAVQFALTAPGGLVAVTGGPGPVDVLAAMLAGFAEDVVDAAPMLVVGIGLAIALPLLVLPGLAARAIARRSVVARSAAERRTAVASPADAAGQVAWLTAEGASPQRLAADRPLVRIGRQDDNDIHIETDAAHRYHALVHRTFDSELWIVDLSGPGGGGVRVNGSPVSEARIAAGDRIEIAGRSMTLVGEMAARAVLETSVPSSKMVG